MAREYAAVRCSIWGDGDWRHLSGNAQHLYFTLLTQGGLSFCGVADYNPKRIAAMTEDFTAETVETAAAMLEERGYFVIDRETDEVFIRSFVRWDGLLRRPNVAVAMAKNYHAIVSLRVRRAFIRELLRLHEDESFKDCTSWGAPKVKALLSEPSTEPVPEPLSNGSTIGTADQCLTTATATASSSTPYNRTLQASEPALRDGPDSRDDVARLCEHLADRVEGNGSKRPRVTDGWRTSARLLMDNDDHTEAEVHAAIDWCQDHNFWRGNVMSMPKLREKYDQLRLVAQSEKAPTRAATPVSTTDQRVAAAQALKAELNSHTDQLAIGAA